MNVHSEDQSPKDEKRRQILEAALELLSDYGFHGASMAKLAEKANVPVGTIYRHFKGKEELIHALYIDMKRERIAAMLEGHDPQAPLRARFDLFWKNTYAYCVSHPREFKFAEQYAFSPYLKDVSKAIQIDMTPELGKFFGDGYAEGIFKSLPPQILSAIITGPLNALVTRAIAGIANLNATGQQSVMDACWDAIIV
ncbi:MAG TPA: TetR/AcrR family transcriptional regulator [Parvibaculum sp.]|jgi:AcrR family transcriptional regulator